MKVLVEEFLEYIKNRKNASENTITSYKRDLIKFLSYLNESRINSFEKTNETTILSYTLYLEKQGKSSATIHRNIVSIRNMFKYLFYNRKVTKDPAMELKLPNVQNKKDVTFTKKDIEILLNQIDDSSLKGIRDKTIIKLLYTTKIKVTELILLKIEQINIEFGYMKYTPLSSEKEIIVALNEDTVYSIKQYLDKFRKSNEQNILFLNLNGQALTRQGVWKIIKFYGDKTNMTKGINTRILSKNLKESV